MKRYKAQTDNGTDLEKFSELFFIPPETMLQKLNRFLPRAAKRAAVGRIIEYYSLMDFNPELFKEL